MLLSRAEWLLSVRYWSGIRFSADRSETRRISAPFSVTVFRRERDCVDPRLAFDPALLEGNYLGGAFVIVHERAVDAGDIQPG
jgi:hypothetical protein